MNPATNQADNISLLVNKIDEFKTSLEAQWESQRDKAPYASYKFAPSEINLEKKVGDNKGATIVTNITWATSVISVQGYKEFSCFLRYTIVTNADPPKNQLLGFFATQEACGISSPCAGIDDEMWAYSNGYNYGAISSHRLRCSCGAIIIPASSSSYNMMRVTYPDENAGDLRIAGASFTFRAPVTALRLMAQFSSGGSTSFVNSIDRPDFEIFMSR
jgi:hypothetical protein